MNEREDGRTDNTSPIATPEHSQMPQVLRPAPPPELSGELTTLLHRIHSGANWFYWIAGLSIVNTLAAMCHAQFSFILGLGVTQIVDAAIQEFGSTAAIVALPINLIIAGVYVLFGYFGSQRMRWALIVGMILYSLDALLFIAVKDWFPLAFHVWALLCIYNALKADTAAREIENQIKRAEYLANNSQTPMV